MSDEQRNQSGDGGADAVGAAIDATAVPILEFGRAWMSAPATAERSKELQLKGPFGFWTTGRAGVLGEVDADVAAAAIGFMAPSMVAELWNDRPVGVTSGALAAEYAEAAARFGREKLASMADDDLRELIDLCERVCEAALGSVGMLFAGWRAMEKPWDPAGGATVWLNVVRELRGGAHLGAVNSLGLGPHGAIMSAADQVRGGPAGAARFGWPEPHPEPDTELRAEAERLTTEACRPAYSVLSAAELARFTELVGEVRATLD